MRQILVVVLVFWTVAAYGGEPMLILPPWEYDYYPDGGFVVFNANNRSDLVRMCGEHDSLPSCYAGKGPGPNGRKCVIFMLPRDEIEALGYNYDALKRHEFGHCNGWPKSHIGARSYRPFWLPDGHF